MLERNDEVRDEGPGPKLDSKPEPNPKPAPSTYAFFGWRSLQFCFLRSTNSLIMEREPRPSACT